MTSPSGRGPRRHRGVVVGGGIVFVIGLAALVLGGWFDAVTADDGGGANIGAGVLVLFGGIVAATGAVMLLVVTAGTVAARTRR
ncbi:hypothetical protein [Curtobacterium sp. MCBD17_003]|uniref:hypothetical protein n=1 Tax=Curtobacterium sp. MCBD17_003 TaxID=2175667 RepID=UPI0011B64EF5|nr:hypothetical protein [Curtobacterium sp. MCBD17_003]WIE56081.1 hypothetical protein DEI88_007795 [Curtobacterium sp. MCBD17_003]